MKLLLDPDFWEVASFIVTVFALPFAIFLFLFEMLIALFERAYIVSYEPDLRGVALRRWNSWDDYMREWCRREDFFFLLPQLLRGEDPDFASYIRRIAGEKYPGQVMQRG